MQELSKQVAVTTAVTEIYDGAGDPDPKIIFLELLDSTAVYLSPRSDVSTSNAGIILGAKYQSITLDQSKNPYQKWYGVIATGTGSSTVGVTKVG